MPESLLTLQINLIINNFFFKLKACYIPKNTMIKIHLFQKYQLFLRFMKKYTKLLKDPFRKL